MTIVWQDEMTMHMHIYTQTHLYVRIRSHGYVKKRSDIWRTRVISHSNRHWLLRVSYSIHNTYVRSIIFFGVFSLLFWMRRRRKRRRHVIIFRGQKDIHDLSSKTGLKFFLLIWKAGRYLGRFDDWAMEIFSTWLIHYMCIFLEYYVKWKYISGTSRVNIGITAACVIFDHNLSSIT